MDQVFDECSVCVKVFSQFSHLNQHQNIHTGVKPYGCSVCVKVLSQFSHLNQHQNIHTGVDFGPINVEESLKELSEFSYPDPDLDLHQN